MQYKVTNISRSKSMPAGIQLEWTDENQVKKRVQPGKFSMVNQLNEVFFTWQSKGWVKIDKLTDPLVQAREEVADKQITANVQELKLGPDDGSDPLHEDLHEPEIDTGNAKEAEMPGSIEANTAPINQSTAQSQDQENRPKRSKGSQNKANKAGVKATQMGTEPTKQVSKNQQVDAMNPLLDETAKNVDNESDSFTVQAPDRSNKEQGRTING